MADEAAATKKKKARKSVGDSAGGPPKKKNKVSGAPAGRGELTFTAGDQLAGTISAWYPGVGIRGSQYGYIQRLLPGPVPMMEHHRFEAAEVNPEIIEQLRKYYPVTFRAAGVDRCGRFRAENVNRDTSKKVKKLKVKEEVIEEVKPDVKKEVANEAKEEQPQDSGKAAGAANPEAPAVLRKVVRKAWKAFEGRAATAPELIFAILTQETLKPHVEALGLEGKELSKFVKRMVKEEGEPTGESRKTPESEKVSAVFRLPSKGSAAA